MIDSLQHTGVVHPAGEVPRVEYQEDEVKRKSLQHQSLQ